MSRKIVKGAVCVLLAAMWACNGLVIVKDPQGQLMVSVDVETPYGVQTKSFDVDTYVFLIKNSLGDTIYRNTVSEVKNTPVSLDEGEYSVIVFNEPFSSPAFGKPYFHAIETAKIVSGEACNVHLICTQKNAGVRVLFSAQYKESYPNGYMAISDFTEELEFNKNTEDLWGYFRAGDVELTLHSDTDLTDRAERTLNANYMYTFLVEQAGDVSVKVEPAFTIGVDTTRIREQMAWNHSDEPPGLTKETACTVAQARQLPADTKDVWVYGYIVGCYSSASSYTPGSEAEVASNIALADNPDEQIKENTYSIELPAGARRNALNLKDNPVNLNKQVWLKGTTSHSYMGVPGLKGLKDYSW